MRPYLDLSSQGGVISLAPTSHFLRQVRCPGDNRPLFDERPQPVVRGLCVTIMQPIPFASGRDCYESVSMMEPSAALDHVHIRDVPASLARTVGD